METLRSTFLYTLYREFKLLFVIALDFLLGTTWFALHSREEFPFLLFGMYSLKETKQPEYVAYTIVIEGKDIVYDNLPDAKQELVATSLANTVSLDTNSLDNAAFTNWLNRYAANEESLEIYKLTCAYTLNGTPQIIKRERLYPHD